MDGEDQSVEQLFVAAVERDVDEDPIVVAGHDGKARGCPPLRYARSLRRSVLVGRDFLNDRCRLLRAPPRGWQGGSHYLVAARGTKLPKKALPNRRRLGEALGCALVGDPRLEAGRAVFAASAALRACFRLMDPVLPASIIALWRIGSTQA